MCKSGSPLCSHCISFIGNISYFRFPFTYHILFVMDKIDYFLPYMAGLVFVLIAGFVIQFLFLKNLSDLLKAVRAPNRRMQPGQVWLVLLGLSNILFVIPSLYAVYTGESMELLLTLSVVLSYLVSIFVLVWEFRMVRRIAESIEAEFDSRSIPIEYRPSYQTGMFMVVSNAFTLLRDVPFVGFLGSIANLAYLIGLIAYWVRTHKYKREIQMLPQHQDEESTIFKDIY